MPDHRLAASHPSTAPPRVAACGCCLAPIGPCDLRSFVLSGGLCGACERDSRAWLGLAHKMLAADTARAA